MRQGTWKKNVQRFRFGVGITVSERNENLTFRAHPVRQQVSQPPLSLNDQGDPAFRDERVALAGESQCIYQAGAVWISTAGLIGENLVASSRL